MDKDTKEKVALAHGTILQALEIIVSIPVQDGDVEPELVAIDEALIKTASLLAGLRDKDD